MEILSCCTERVRIQDGAVNSVYHFLVFRRSISDINWILGGKIVSVMRDFRSFNETVVYSLSAHVIPLC